MKKSKKASPRPDDQLVAYTLNVPARWLADFDTMAAREIGSHRSDHARKAMAIGLDVLKKRPR